MTKFMQILPSSYTKLRTQYLPLQDQSQVVDLPENMIFLDAITNHLEKIATQAYYHKTTKQYRMKLIFVESSAYQ